MRPQPKKPIEARGKVLGGLKPLVCIPLVGKTREEILGEAGNIPDIAPDIIELRVDAWEFVEDTAASISMIRDVRKAVGEIPVILTCRGHWEGGFKKVSDSAKFSLYRKAAEEGLVDFLDVELIYGDEKIRETLAMIANYPVSLIVSSHDFEKTPPKEVLFSTLAAQIRAGAHVAKLAAMPRSEEDVLALLSATLLVRREYPDIPLITMSMGGIGAVSRVTGGLFGSDLTFAVGSKASAPGQIPAADLKQCLSVLYPL
ncbi:MAG: type I 3-dehydroquinate dehydratase [Synergistaceae bacterium]|nr:type I 3-dehydroquinate dehydratase [Synergistaceae bacterium]